MSAPLEPAEILRVLYPSPHEVVISRPVSRDGFLALPSHATARLLLPGSGSAGAAALRHARRPYSLRSRAVTSLTCAALRTGGARFALAGFDVRRAGRAESIETLLASVLGRPVVVGIFLGPPRANRKPVLQVLDEGGGLLAIAKVGLNPLTRELAANEGAALADLGSRPGEVLVTPRLLHLGEWRGHTVLVQSALDLVGAPVDVDPSIRHAAMRHVAAMNGVVRRPWSDSAYAVRLTARVEALTDSDLSRRLRQAVESLVEAPSVVPFGTWHGDWTAWNMAVRDGRALVWDWERYQRDVPVGFDALHYAFMPALKSQARRASAAVSLLAGAGETLAAFDVPKIEARRIAFAYILDLATRYMTDGQADTGVGGGDVAQWLIPALGAVSDGSIAGIGSRDG